MSIAIAFYRYYQAICKLVLHILHVTFLVSLFSFDKHFELKMGLIDW